MGFAFKFDFLSPEQNAVLSESVNCICGYALDEVKAANRSLNNRLHTAEENAAFLQSRSEKLTAERQEACKEAEKLKEELREVRLELVDCRRANVVLRESLEKEREQGARLSSPCPADVDVEGLISQIEVMAKVIEKLKDELRAVNDGAKCSSETAEAKYKKLAVDAEKELRAYKDFTMRLARIMKDAPDEYRRRLRDMFCCTDSRECGSEGGVM